jgi:hypothetical protein
VQASELINVKSLRSGISMDSWLWLDKNSTNSIYQLKGNMTMQRTSPFELHLDLATSSYKFCQDKSTSRAREELLFNETKLLRRDEVHPRKVVEVYTSVISNPLCTEGNWTDVTKDAPHLHIPSLDIQIPYFYNFTRECNLEPFMQIYSTEMLSAVDIDTQARRTWTKSNSPDMLGRTASFGAGQGRLELCVRRETGRIKNGSTLEGEEERILVPMGLMAAMRAKWKGQIVPDREFC